MSRWPRRWSPTNASPAGGSGSDGGPAPSRHPARGAAPAASEIVNGSKDFIGGSWCRGPDETTRRESEFPSGRREGAQRKSARARVPPARPDDDHPAPREQAAPSERCGHLGGAAVYLNRFDVVWIYELVHVLPQVAWPLGVRIVEY